MKRNLIISTVLLIALISCQKGSYERIENGVLVHLKDSLIKTIQIKIYDDNIVRVTASPGDTLKEKESLIVISKGEKVKWSVMETENEVVVKTPEINTHVSLMTGQVVFKDKNDKTILEEVKEGGKIFTPVTIADEKKYEIQQVFKSDEDEAFYGLGQHQHAQMNYKGEDVELAQHNIVAVVPFLYSSKNYGILWDNYSITRFGDPREYEQINSLKLYNKDGNEGGLIASYTERRTGKVIRKEESVIDYQNIDEQGNMPEFLLNKGKVVWEGYVASDEAGKHKFLLYASEYFKLWIEDSLYMDKWRQGWNPWSNKVSLEMEKGKKYKIKLEWIPVSLAYLSLKHLDPYDPVKQEQLSLFSEVADQIDYYFIKGKNADEVISGYRELTGKAPIMPKWAMGLWQSRERYHNEEELLGVVKEYRKRNIPLDNIVLDWHYWEEDKWGSHEFDSTRFMDPEGMIDELHNELNAHIMISVWPKFYKGTEHYDEMNEKGFLFQRYPDKNLKDWVGYYSTFYDPFNDEARELFWEQMKEHLFTKGIDAWWMDATEPDMHSNFSVEERKLLMSPTALGSGAEYFNAFSLMNSKGVYEGWMEAAPDVRPFILTRSAFAGQQRYSAATWSGDVVSRWSDLKDQIAAGINFSLSGIPYWTTDIGGFSLERRYERASGRDLVEWRELMNRWNQFGTFCPLYRIHGQFPYREIYNTAPAGHPVYESMVYYDKLRYRLMPYIYSLAGLSYIDDYTIMRGLIMDHSDDLNVRDIDDQYMFGPSLMINPVCRFMAKERDVYLPSTSGWFDIYTGEFFEGGQTIIASAPLNKIPVFAHEGAILLFGPEIQYATEKKADPLTIYVYTGKDGAFKLYEDDGLNNAYKKGKYSIIPVSYNQLHKVCILGKRKGEYPDMLEERTINIVFVNKGENTGIDDENVKTKTIVYDGTETSVIND